jgi:hypothetical protein
MCNDIVDRNIIESELYKNFMEIAVLSTMEILKDYEENIYNGVKNGNKEFLSTYYEKGYSFQKI